MGHFLPINKTFGFPERKKISEELFLPKKGKNSVENPELKNTMEAQKSICKLNEGISFNGKGKTNIPQVA